MTKVKPARAADLSDDERKLIRGFGLMTLKPTMYIANVAEDGFENNPHLEAVKNLLLKKMRLLCRFATKSKLKFHY